MRLPYRILAATLITTTAWAQAPANSPARVSVPPPAVIITQAPPAPAPTPPAATPAAASSVASGPRQLPPSRFYGTVAGDELFNLIKADTRYSKLDKDLVGSPILLRVTNSFEMSSGGRATGMASAILAGGSLGLLPLVTNGDQVITYEVVVNSTPLMIYTYRKNFTRSTNIWAKDTTYGLGKDGLAWAKGTVAQFLTDTASDQKTRGAA